MLNPQFCYKCTIQQEFGYEVDLRILLKHHHHYKLLLQYVKGLGLARKSTKTNSTCEHRYGIYDVNDVV